MEAAGTAQALADIRKGAGPAIVLGDTPASMQRILDVQWSFHARAGDGAV